MAEENKFFGFSFKRKKSVDKIKAQSFAPENEDGAYQISPSGGYFGQYTDLDGDTFKNDSDLIMKYRSISNYPEVDAAIEDITNEAISSVGAEVVKLNLDDLDQADNVKKLIQEEFDNVLKLLDFSDMSYDLFRRWYIDGRLFHHVIIDKNGENGIKALRQVDPTKIRKVKEIVKEKDPATGAELVREVQEYYLYQDEEHINNSEGLKISTDAIIQVNSGLLNDTRDKVVGYLNKALKPLNQLTMMEDFWLPRREGGRGTEITTLPGGQNLGEVEDIIYFQKKLYRSLNVPMSRLEADSAFNVGRSSEITRDELKFQKFIDRVRTKFSKLFLEVLKRQLILKKIIVPSDWNHIKEDLDIEFVKDNYYAELKDAEMLKERIETLQMMDEYVGMYYSKEWVRKNILKQDDELIAEIDKQIEAEPDEDIDVEAEGEEDY